MIVQVPNPPSRLPGLDALRDLAALAVTWFHMTHGGELLPSSGGLWWIARALGGFGHHGITLFFLLSGFVIPYALLRAGSTSGSGIGIFLAKRLVRLQPPFLAACLLAIGLNLLSMRVPGYDGPLGANYRSEVFLRLLSDNLYITGILGQSWILVVAWTLAIEVQFYLVAGFSRRWLIARPLLLFAAVVAASLVLPQSMLVFHWLPVFALGSLVAVRFPAWSWRDASLAGLLLVLIGFAFSPKDAVVAAGSLALMLLAVQGRLPAVPLLPWLGGISYSLYLVHVPIGGRVVNLAARLSPSPMQQLLICCAGVGVSVAFAWLFWYCIEKPSHHWSRRLFTSPAQVA